MLNVRLGKGFSTYNVIEFNKLGNSSYIQISNPISGQDLNLIKKERKDLDFPVWNMQFEGSTNVFEYSFILNGISVKEFNNEDIFILIAEININFNDLKEVNIYKIPVVKCLSPITKSKEKVELPSQFPNKIKKNEKVKEIPEVYDDGSIQRTLFDEENIESSNSTIDFESMGEDDEQTTFSNTPKGGYNGKTKRKITKKRKNIIPRTPRDKSNHLIEKINSNDIDLISSIAWRRRSGNYGVGLKLYKKIDDNGWLYNYYDVYVYTPYTNEIFKTDITFRSINKLAKAFPSTFKKNNKTMVLSILIPEHLRDPKIKEDIENKLLSKDSGMFAQITQPALITCMKDAKNKK
jgi:hypothetical protein